MVQSLLDLPDATLSEILRLLPTGRQLLNALESSRQLQALVAADPTVWEPLASTYEWLVRRAPGESFAAYFRRVHGSAAYLIALGGDRGEIFSHITLGNPSADVYDFHQRLWLERPAPELNTWRNAPCMAVHGGIAYAIGGWDEAEDEALASIESIPVATAAAVATAASPSLADGSDAAAGGASTSSEWSSQLLPDMPEPRCFAAATFDASGRLWVAGGGDAMSRGADCLTSIIRLDVDSGGSSASSGSAAGWDRVGDMLQPRCGLALAADGRTSTLYCCGGYSGGTCYQQTVETFDMSGERDGQMLPPMACSRSGCGAGVGPDGALYVVGGSDDGSAMLASCERFDPREVRADDASHDLLRAHLRILLCANNHQLAGTVPAVLTDLLLSRWSICVPRRVTGGPSLTCPHHAGTSRQPSAPMGASTWVVGAAAL